MLRFRLSDRFLFRAPGFEWGKIRPYLLGSRIARSLSNPHIREALLSASGEYVSRLGGGLDDAAALKLAQYLIRMSSRSTPFGFLAGVGMGRLGAENRLPANFRSESRRLQTGSVYSRLCSPAKDHKKSRYLLNPTLIDANGRLSLLTLGERSTEPTYLRLRLAGSHQAFRFLGSLRAPATFNELAQKAANERNASVRSARARVEALIRSGVLVPARKPLFEPEPFKSYHSGRKQTSGIANLVFDAECTLSRKSATKILSACETLLQIGLSERLNPRSTLVKRVRDFLELNHPHSPVPLLALRDEVLAPEDIGQGKPWSEVESFLGRKLVTGEKLWQLSESDLQALGHSADKELAPAISVLTRVFPEKHGWSFHPHFAVFGSASMLHGRFGPCLPGIDEIIREIHRHEKDIWSNCLLADLEHLVASPGADVTVRTSSLDTFIDTYGAFAGAKERIPLSDLVLSLDEKREVQLCSASRKMRVIPHLTHALNLRNDGHFAVRLLAELAPCGAPFLWTWGRLEEIFERFPRVQLGDVIVSPEQWALALAKGESLERKLEDLAVPRMVYLRNQDQFDQKLLLDLKLPIARRILRDATRKRPRVFLEEAPAQSPAQVEVLLTATQKVVARAAYPPKACARSSDRIIPGGRCLYWKLVADPADFDFIVTRLCRRLIRPEIPFFFVKYRDPEPHLRIRFFGERETVLRRIEAAAQPLLLRMTESHLVHRVDILTYAREIERYQGPKGCDVFEHLSFVDSQNILKILMLMEQAAIEKSLPLAACVGTGLVAEWSRAFIPEPAARMDFCVRMGRSRRKLDRLPPLSETQRAQAARLLSAIGPFSAKLGDLIQGIPGITDPEIRDDFAASIIHMSLNRWSAGMSLFDAHSYRSAVTEYLGSRRKPA